MRCINCLNAPLRPLSVGTSLDFCLKLRGVGEELREAHAWWRTSHRVDELLLSHAPWCNHDTSLCIWEGLPCITSAGAGWQAVSVVRARAPSTRPGDAAKLSFFMGGVRSVAERGDAGKSRQKREASFATTARWPTSSRTRRWAAEIREVLWQRGEVGRIWLRV